jgi:uncharacterized iron-regulated protein
MHRIIVTLASLGLLLGVVSAAGELEDRSMYDLVKGRETSLSMTLPRLKEKRVILVGELHDSESHHMAQLSVIKALHTAGVPVAIGLEMFRTDSQGALDRFIYGSMGLEEFKKIYYDNWNLPWPLYAMIFEYAKEEEIPLVGLNVPRDVTRQVAQKGFQSLTDEQKGKLSDVVCKVDKDYMAFISRSFGAHAHGQLNFTYFCEAQLVWDNAMAFNALDYLKANPERSMVLLAGNGHAWKKGIPEQIRKRSSLPHAVILPSIPGYIEPGIVTDKDADYLILDP